MNNSMANKHLSDTAKKGRFGDTELVHVNKQERDLLKALGGSGTINPETGLREYFDPFTALGFGLSLYQTHQQSQSQKSTARTTSKYAQQGINELETAEKHLETAVGARKDLALQKHEKEKEDFSFQMDTTIADTNKEIQNIVKKSNMAVSGTAKEKESTQFKRIAATHKSGMEGLIGKLGEDMATITEFQETEKSRIRSEKRRLMMEKELADKQANQGWFS